MTFLITTIVIAYLVYLVLIPLFFVPSEPHKFAADYRIVKTTYKNTHVDFTIQQRFPFTPFWLYCHKEVGMDSYRIVEFLTEKQAKEYLKRHTDVDTSDEIVKKEYIK